MLEILLFPFLAQISYLYVLNLPLFSVQSTPAPPPYPLPFGSEPLNLTPFRKILATPMILSLLLNTNQLNKVCEKLKIKLQIKSIKLYQFS